MFDPIHPRVEDIFRRDIAHSLSNKCRYSGHTRRFYSVAEHSVRVSWCLRDMGCSLSIQYWGLHHDDEEAYLVDLPTPLKALPEFAWFKVIATNLQSVICKAFALSVEEPPVVKEADRILLVTEKRDLMPPHDWTKQYVQQPLAEKIKAWGPKKAERVWLQRCKELEDALQGENREWRSSLQAGLQAEYQVLERLCDGWSKQRDANRGVRKDTLSQRNGRVVPAKEKRL